MLDLVNQHFPDILPEDVLKHYGYDARPEGDLGEDALYSTRDPDSVSTRSLLANALESVAQHEVELQKLQEYKAKIADVEAKEARLQEIYSQLYPGSADMPAQQKRELQQEAAKIRNAITIIDKQLFRQEAIKPLQYVLNAERNRVPKEHDRQQKSGIPAGMPDAFIC